MADSNIDTGAEQEFVITRIFDAPRDLVFRACTEPDRLSHWWGPKGFIWVGCTMDLRTGGVFHYCMRPPGGQEMWGKWVYREIVPPERIVFVSSFSDAHGNTVRAPFNPAWPLEVLNILTLIEQAGKTILTLRGEPLDATEMECTTYNEGRPSMRQGFAATFDQLDEYLRESLQSERNHHGKADRHNVGES
jgi:uncharacterized protein YndB with AHSA1/START domain